MIKTAVLIFCAIGLSMCSLYLLLPTPDFPNPPPNVLVSKEPADTESLYRRSYYSNYTRAEIMNYYRGVFTPSLQLVLNYPPEEAQLYIRDQTRSSWLQEIVHPGRDSLFINGFYPSKPTEQINIDGVHYQNKITVHLLPSKPITRITVLSLAGIALYLLVKEYAKI